MIKTLATGMIVMALAFAGTACTKSQEPAAQGEQAATEAPAAEAAKDVAKEAMPEAAPSEPTPQPDAPQT